MAVEKESARKGFIYTLEAIIGSALLLGVVLTVTPQFQQDASMDPQRQVHSGLEALYRTGNLTDNLSTAQIESDLEPYTPDAFNYSVNVVETETVSENISSPYQEYIDTSGDNSELQLWIDSSSGLNVSFNNESVLKDYSGSGYELASIQGTEGWLNFTGAGELEYRFSTYRSSSRDIDAESVSVTSYLVNKNGTKEIRVRMWE